MRLRNAWIALGVAVTLGSASVATPAHAADIFEDIRVTSAPLLDIDPSVRSVAMGGASTAVFWGDGVNHWANPALLGTASGVRFDASDVSLLPEVFPGFKFRTRRVTLGYGGLGVALAGQPFDGLGEQRLEYNAPPGDYFPGGTSVLYPEETERSWGAGLSLAQGLESLARWRGNEAPNWARRSDVAFGLNRKTVTDNTLEPENPQRVVAYDWGTLARTSIPLRRTLGSHPGSLDVAIAAAMLNANDARIYGDPTARQQRIGGAVRTSMDVPESMAKRMPAWLSPGVTSLASVALAYDATRVSAGGSPRGRSNVNAWGVELGLGGLLFGRLGGSHNSIGSGSTNNTWGLGAALPLGRLAAVHYDYARVDRPFGGHMAPQSWAVVVDPVAIAKRL